MRRLYSSIFAAVPCICLGLLLGACATPYQRTGFAGGFSETQLAPDVFRVSFNGNGYTSAERAADFALLRGAELCAQRGYPYMTLLDSNTETRTESYVTPRQAQTYGTVNTYGNTATYSGTTTYTGGQVMTFYKPGVGLLIRGLKEKPNASFAFDTGFLIETLRTKYRLGGETGFGVSPASTQLPASVQNVASTEVSRQSLTDSSVAATNIANANPAGPGEPRPQFRMSFDQAWSRVLQMLAMDGAQITISDKTSGVIQFAGSYAGKPGLFSCPKTSGVLTEQKFSGTVLVKPAAGNGSSVDIQTAGTETRYMNRHLLMFKTGHVDHSTPCQSTGRMEQLLLQRLSAS